MRGGARQGAGRPAGSGQYGEPTRHVRVPVSRLPVIRAWLAGRRVRLSKLGALPADPNPKPLARPLLGMRVSCGLPSPTDDFIDNIGAAGSTASLGSWTRVDRIDTGDPAAMLQRNRGSARPILPMSRLAGSTTPSGRTPVPQMGGFPRSWRQAALPPEGPRSSALAKLGGDTLTQPLLDHRPPRY